MDLALRTTDVKVGNSCVFKLVLCFCRYHNGDAYIIDVSQSVEHDHPHALEFLRKDCSNVNGKCLKTSKTFFVRLLS